jgi:GTP-dependent phosphoenolpyruvate carboxykinase
VESENWQREMADIAAYFGRFGARVPRELLEEHRRVVAALG